MDIGGILTIRPMQSGLGILWALCLPIISVCLLVRNVFDVLLFKKANYAAVIIHLIAVIVFVILYWVYLH